MDKEKDKTLTILNLLLKSVLEDGEWLRFMRKLRAYCKSSLNKQLTDGIENKGLEKACHLLYDALGHPFCLQAVYATQEALSEDSEEEKDCATIFSRESTDTEDEYYEAEPIPISEEKSKETDTDTESDTTPPAPEPIGSNIESSNSTVEKIERELVQKRQRNEKTEEEETTVNDTVPHIRKHFERQAMMLMGALKDKLESVQDEPISVEAIQFQLERFIFNPPKSIPPDHVEVRYNFYPPFSLPKSICNYHIFSMTAPIPKSCKANRYGTQLFEKVRHTDYFKTLPKWRTGVEIDDGLGSEAVPVGELDENIKMIPLENDISRMQWAKGRASHILFFSYPSLHMPPKLSKMLMEQLIQPIVEENNKMEEAEMSVSDEEIAYILDSDGKMPPSELANAIKKRRNIVAMGVRYCVELELMQRIFRDPSMVKKCQEALHHTFHHGYVRLVRDVAKVNLSNFITFHGCTYNNPLNNAIMAHLLEGTDKEDYIVDSIYLFLVIAWQTAMGMWQQAIDDETVKVYTEAFRLQRRIIYSLTNPNEVANYIVNLLMDGDRLAEEMRKALPNFTSLSQISSFRQFMLERSNIPSFAAPFLPSDFVPLTFKQAQPILWSQVYLMHIAYYLMNHGGYLWESESESQLQRAYCPCNLCSPHRMPQDNVALHNEILAINTFEIKSAEGKSFTLTPELWTNAYLDVFVPAEFHPFSVIHYTDHQSSFKTSPKGCVTSSPEIFSLIRQIQENREEFLLQKGKGVYKDPKTGDVISHDPQSSNVQAGSSASQGLPASGTHSTRRAIPPSAAAKPVRIQNGSNGTKDVGKSKSAEGCAIRWIPDTRRGGHRWRNHRKPGHRNGGRGGQGGINRITEGNRRRIEPSRSGRTTTEEENEEITSTNSSQETK